MKSIFLIALMSVALCGKPDFEVTDATQQKWIAGVRGGGYGINYKIEIQTKQSSDILKIDQLWIGEKSFKIQLVKDKENQFNPVEVTDFVKDEKLFIIASETTATDRNGEPIPENDKVANNPPPYKYDGQALIGYTLKNKRMYKVVKEIKVLENINHP